MKKIISALTSFPDVDPDTTAVIENLDRTIIATDLWRIDLSTPAVGVVKIENILVYRRGEGTGTMVLRRLIEAARAARLSEVFLVPFPCVEDGDTRPITYGEWANLYRWYEREGFVLDDDPEAEEIQHDILGRDPDEVMDFAEWERVTLPRMGMVFA